MDDVSIRAETLYLALDAVNTRVKFGLFDPAAKPLPHCLWHSFILCGQPLPDTLFDTVPADTPVRSLLSGSNPPEMARLAAEWRPDWPLLHVLRDQTELPVAIDVDAPEKVGLDRLLNAVAAQQIRADGQPVVIVDSGTATTVDYVDRQGTFCGGAILPGIGMSARALNDYTALLPLIPARDVTFEAPDVIGRNTVAAMKSGLFWGHVGAVRELTSQMLSRDSGAHPPLILATGGAGASLAPWLPSAQVHPFLPLQGLVLSASADGSVASQPRL